MGQRATRRIRVFIRNMDIAGFGSSGDSRGAGSIPECSIRTTTRIPTHEQLTISVRTGLLFRSLTNEAL